VISIACLLLGHGQPLFNGALGRIERSIPDSTKKAECKFAPRHESRMDRVRLPPCDPSA
jgi:hypothetical protein